MQRAAKHLAGIATHNRCNDWITNTCEMLRLCLMRRMLCMTVLI